ncbi:MAG TPA: hypothetical protein PLY00_18005 [Verrucomicrobiota bacterium]|nr:hypothetical protein [Verrucomicrobiota bacterium]OQC68184.1 MAG: hypothetical protein BWX48_00166 [Verrucomicrobia bacterium ADurb.Bin006]HOR73153.1 hypothetical protein [Verrucomicrobiota bacterium]HQK02458.1 hypothetical protein [Verrucomicrobiota bacterium]
MRTRTIIVLVAAGCVALMALLLILYWRGAPPAVNQKQQDIYGSAPHPKRRSSAIDTEKIIADSRSTEIAHEQRMSTKMTVDQASRSAASLESAVRLLSSREGDVREAGGVILAATGTEDAVRALLDAINRESDSGVRDNLVECIRGITNAAAAPALARQAMDVSDLNLHRICRNALSEMSDPAAVTTLLHLLEQTPPESVEPLAYALSHTQSQEALPILSEGASSKTEVVARSCIEAMRNLGTAEACTALLKVIVREESDSRRQYATIALNEMALECKDARLVDAFSEVLKSEAGTQAMKAAVDGLALMAAPSAGTALMIERENVQDAEMRSYIAQALSRRQNRFGK